jgi:AmmeMemoRadiSam system protein B
MSLVFAGIVPHPPLLIPEIGKDKTQQLAKTKAAFEQLEQDLYIAKPQVIVVISPHTGRFEEAFTINAHTHFFANYEEFGEFSIKKEWKGMPDMGARIAQHAVEKDGFPVRLISEEKLDHGVSIPLHFLCSHLDGIKIVPIGYSGLDAKMHLSFGELLKHIVFDTDKRVAVIASGDMSHCLVQGAPGGFHASGKVFDDTLIELLQTRNTVGITQMDQTVVKDAQECSYRSTLILLGLLRDMDYTFKNYSYESPFGVGYLVGNFVF